MKWWLIGGGIFLFLILADLNNSAPAVSNDYNATFLQEDKDDTVEMSVETALSSTTTPTSSAIVAKTVVGEEFIVEEPSVNGEQIPTSTTSPVVAEVTILREFNDSVIPSNMYRVTRVIDGDTIEVATDTGVKRVRYIGVDTPETVHPSKPIECFGKEASNKNKELVEGKWVRLERDISDTDRYGRWLRYVYVDDEFVNQLLVAEGYATVVTYPPDVKHAEQFRVAERAAREARTVGKCLRSVGGTYGATHHTSTNFPNST